MSGRLMQWLYRALLGLEVAPAKGSLEALDAERETLLAARSSIEQALAINGRRIDAAIDRLADAEPSAPSTTKTSCNYPKCNCPFDAPADPNWCARRLPRGSRVPA